MDKKKDDGKGWVSIHRSIQDHWLWDNKPFSKGQAWIDLILLANHEDKKTEYRGQVITCERGTVCRSILSLSDRWGWERKKTTKFLHALENDGMVKLNVTTNRTTITLVNYDIYQNRGTTNSTTNGTTRGQREGQTLPTNNNETIKQLNNMNDSASKHFHAPSVEEVQKYCRERGNNVDAERFIDYYSARGWELAKGRKMKDWKAAIRTWEKNKETWGESSKGEKYDSKQRELYRDFF